MIVFVSLIVLSFIEPFLTTYVNKILINTFFILDEQNNRQLDVTKAQPFLDLFINSLRILRVILWMAFVVALVRFIHFVVFKRTADREGKAQAPTLMRNIFSIVIYIVALFTLLKSQYPGVDLTSVFTTSTILGIIIGLALQDTLGNLFAGLAMQADEPFRVGDVIHIPNKGTGVVESVTWRGVKIRTFTNRLVVISNAILGKEIIEVSPRDNLNARLVNFSTRYTDSPAKTIKVVRDLVRQVENVSPKIRPIVRVRNLGDNGIEWEVKFWLEDYTKYNDTDALVRQRIWYAFQREDIGMPFPMRTLEFVKGEEKEPVDMTQNNIIDRLSEVQIFAPLSEEETRSLAEATEKRIFAPKEIIVRAGEKGQSMFVVHRGSVNVQYGEHGHLRDVNTLHEGNIFGEMSCFTGEPRSATVTAAEETEVLEIGHSALEPLFQNNPDLAGAISTTIAERHIQLAAKKEEGTLAETAEKSSGIFKAIKKFFRLEQK